ncbi:MAG: KamA family radical SAM protein [Verrucomicrobia bacterium]|nr:KamA family radical SAM protein [Verrucomicrobiota bacterium]
MTALTSQKTVQLPLWRQIQRQNFLRWDDLVEYLQLSSELRQKVLPKGRFPLNLPRRLAQKIQKNSINDPILRQFVPLQEEETLTDGYTLEPLQDPKFLQSKKLLHKYQGRALILTTSACAMHCRFCFRQNYSYETETIGFEDDLTYIAQETDLSEIILSGGDPLSLNDGQLQSLLQGLELIPHVKRVRFHTRFPIGIPERLDDSFLQVLEASSKQIVFIIHCNHPRELDSDVADALKRVQKLGIPVLNQTVLLKGVNDDEAILLELSESLVQAGVLPYYLHLHDLVQGTAHFLVSDERGKELVQYLHKHTSGYAVPRLVREVPGQPGKTLIL